MEVRLLQSVLRAPALLLPAQQKFGEMKNCLLHFASVPKNVRTHGSRAWSTSKACHIKSYRMTQETLKWHIERPETSNFETTLRFGLGKGTLIHVRLERGCWLPGLLVENSGELLYQMHFTEIQEEEQERHISHKKLKILCIKCWGNTEAHVFAQPSPEDPEREMTVAPRKKWGFADLQRFRKKPFNANFWMGTLEHSLRKEYDDILDTKQTDYNTIETKTTVTCAAAL